MLGVLDGHGGFEGHGGFDGHGDLVVCDTRDCVDVRVDEVLGRGSLARADCGV